MRFCRKKTCIVLLTSCSSHVTYSNHQYKSSTNTTVEVKTRAINVPFRAPWKKKRTTKTCSAAIDSIIRPSITLKLKIRRSVLRTVLKLRFSRVRKYFWFREMVDTLEDSL